MKKTKVLIIFKYPHPYWNVPFINQFSNYYDTEHIYLSDYKNKNFTEIINIINNLIKSKNIEIVVFDVDYFRFINFFFIEEIKSKKKVLITGDDFELHEMNSITASSEQADCPTASKARILPGRGANSNQIRTQTYRPCSRAPDQQTLRRPLLEEINEMSAQ